MFKNDLKVWKAIEREFASKLMNWNVSKIEFSEWKFPDRDIKATFHKQWQTYEKTFEVKADFQAEKTWNIGIEYMCNWKPSWIYTSKSDYVAYKVGDKFYYADRIRLIIELSKVNKSDVCGGDDDNSQMWLVKRDIFNLITTEL